MARSMMSFGVLWARAETIALRSRALPAGSPPPVFAAMVISRANLLKSAARFVSIAPLKCLTLDHLLCPAMRWDSKSCRTDLDGAARPPYQLRFILGGFPGGP